MIRQLFCLPELCVIPFLPVPQVGEFESAIVCSDFQGIFAFPQRRAFDHFLVSTSSHSPLSP